MANQVEALIRSAVTKGMETVASVSRAMNPGPADHPFLSGIHTPMAAELEIKDLSVTGTIPAALDGRFLRIGPNPVAPDPAGYHWFIGDGMVHGLRIQNGRALWYKNRWIRSKERKVDALSVIALVGITLSLLMFAGGGSAQLIALKEKLVTLLFAFAFLGSAVIGKPLIYPLARATMARQSKEAADTFEQRRDEAPVRYTVMVMTWVWGLALLAEGLLSILLVYSLPMELYLIVGPILGYVTFGSLGAWTFLYRCYRTKKVAAEQQQ